MSLIYLKRLADDNKLKKIFAKCSSYIAVEETYVPNINKIILNEAFKITQPKTSETL